ncbi:MAG: hypothetical protein HOP30_15040 [Cyclobacteriaceae bacterium]|nr:hypothetical protein [Cyclobacteriaceae bacterium]
MKWTGRRESSNVDDQRGSSGGGGGGGFPGGLLSKGGLGTIVVVLLISWLTGTNPLTLLQQTNIDSGPTQSVTLAPSPEEEELSHFVAVVLASTVDGLQAQLPGYRFPVLELFRDQTQSGCGSATSASGPFYCSAD